MTFSRTAAALALLSAPVALACLLAAAVAARFDMAAFGDPVAALGTGAERADWVRSSMILDMFGYYLMLAPAVVALHAGRVWQQPEWTRLLTYCGLGYVTVGAAGAAVLTAAWPPLILAYQHAASGEAATVRLAFEVLTHVVHGGLWNSLEMVFAAIFWGGHGVLAMRDRPMFGALSAALGAVCLVVVVGTLAGLDALRSVALPAYLLLAPQWATAFGVLHWRDPARRAWSASDSKARPGDGGHGRQVNSGIAAATALERDGHR